VLVAVEDGSILAVGSVTNAGQITLNCIAGRKISWCQSSHARALERGADQCRLLSTETARRFSRSAGYGEDGPPQGKFGTTSSYPMSKRLTGKRGMGANSSA
jgi:hypothetical protein